MGKTCPSECVFSRGKRKLKESIENIGDLDSPTAYFVLTLFFSIIFGKFLESLLKINFYGSAFDMDAVIGLTSIYLIAAFTISFLLSILFKKEFVKTEKIVFTGSSIIVLLPFVDITGAVFYGRSILTTKLGSNQLGMVDLTLNFNNMFVYIFLILIAGLITIVYYIYRSEQLKLIIKDIRPYRLMHYELMFILGIVLAVNITDQTINFPYDLFKLGVVVIAILLAWLYSVFVNNIEDIEIDKVTNEERPLIGGDIDEATYKNLSWALLFGTVLFAYSVSEVFLFLLLTFVASYFIYSAEPLRLKRIPFLSKGFISVNSLVLAVGGFYFVDGSLSSFPAEIVVLFMVGFTAVMNFIDIKDYKGDKKAGIKTLPVLMGLKRSKKMIGIFFLATFLGAYFIFSILWILIPLSLFGTVELYLVTREDYQEKYVFGIYLIGLVALLGLRLLS